MKKYLLMLCCAAVCAGFVGCSDDDEGVDVSVESLAGRWSCYQEWDAEDSYMDDDFGEGIDLYILEFNADGTCRQFDGLYLSELDDEKYWVRFTYTLEGSQLIMRESGEVDEPRVEKCRVAKITSSELVLDYGLEKLYFRRMK